jgi:hypothetical protein
MALRVLTTNHGRGLPSGFRIWAAAFVCLACLGFVGCAGFNARGDGFPKDETFDSVGKARPVDQTVDSFGFSNKARQIERDFGAR